MTTLPPQTGLQASAAPCKLHNLQARLHRSRKRACQPQAYSYGASASAASAASSPAASNLGVLQPLAAPDPQQAALFLQQQQAVAAEFSGGGVINVDGPAIAASLLVLLMLLALSFNRILGLERLLGKWLLALQERRKYERRNEVIQARLTLEQQFASPPEDGDEQQGGDDSTRRPRRPGGGGTPGSDRV